MAIQKIQYTNKEQLVNDTTIKDKYKCKADDLNEIKSVVNNNADEIPSNDNLVHVGTSIDTDYKVNVLTTKNLFDKNNANILNVYFNNSGVISYNDARSIYIKCKPNTSYTIKKDGSVRFRIGTTNVIPDSNVSIIDYVQNDNDEPITITTSNNANYLIVYLYLTSDTNTKTFEQVLPTLQIEYGSTATTYEPFIQNTINVNNEKYTDTINVGTSINDKNRVNVLYSKNLFDIKNAQIVQETLSDAGIKLTFNDDGTITANGTNTKTYRFIRYNITLPAGTYYYSGCPSGGTTNGYSMQTINPNTADFGNGGTFTLTQTTTVGILPIRIGSDTITFNNAIFKPMLAKVQVSYNDYEPYITPSINIDGNEIYSKASNEYTTSEQVIGRWIDGKPLYRKVVDFGTLPNATSKTISTGLTASTTRITKIDGVARDNSSGYCIAIPHINTNNLGGGIQIEFNTSGEIFIRTSANYSSLNGYMILEYTKTTD